MTMEKLWNDRKINRESGMFAGTTRINLMFPAENIVEICQHSTGVVYRNGVDYLHHPGDDFITRPETSRIPFFPESALHPVENLRLYPAVDANAVNNAVDGGNLLFDNAGFFALNQIDITYTATGMPDFVPELSVQSDRLPRFRAKLAAGEKLRATLIGDSISAGFNATKFVNIPPFAPGYMEQVCNELDITLINRAVEGTGIRHAFQIEKEYLSDAPDLLVIAYGMNDFSNLPVADYLIHLQKLIDNCRAVNKHTEFLIVTAMSGNPLWKFTIPGPDALYAAGLRQAVSAMPPYAALADVAKVWQKFLKRKSFYDLTGNGVNHPNDYGHRIYASTILQILNNNRYF